VGIPFQKRIGKKASTWRKIHGHNIPDPWEEIVEIGNGSKRSQWCKWVVFFTVR
jgi:hypothetical protein